MISDRKRPQHIRISKDSPYYPMSYKGYIPPARLVMAQHLDRCLGSDECIYYIDGNPFNPDISNLQLVSHKEITKMHEIRGIVRQVESLSSQLTALRSELAEIRFNHTPCDCSRCMRSREARQAGYKL